MLYEAGGLRLRLLYRPQVRLAAWNREKPGTWYSTFRRGKKVGATGTRLLEGRANPALGVALAPRLSPALSRPPPPRQFSYVDADGNPVPVPQLTFLRLLSASARQNFTLTCQHAAAWYDAPAASFARALRFRGANDEELGHDHPAAPVRALRDGCQVRPPYQFPYPPSNPLPVSPSTPFAGVFGVRGGSQPLDPPRPRRNAAARSGRCWRCPRPASSGCR